MNTILEQIGSILIMLIMFGLVLYGSYYCSKKVAKMSVRESRSKYMKLEDRLLLGQEKHVSIVSIGERYFLIGTSADTMTILAELHQEDLQQQTNPEQGFSTGYDFSQIMKKLGKNKDNLDGDRR